MEVKRFAQKDLEERIPSHEGQGKDKDEEGTSDTSEK
jgi:hypothetical protein